MANFTDKLALIITGDSTNAVTSLRKVSTAADTELGKTKASGGTLQSAFGSLTRTIDAIPAPLVAAGAAAAAFGISAVKAAEQGQAVHARLETAIKNNGEAYKTYGEAIEGASRKAATFGFENDEVEASIARLIPATKSTKKAIEDQALAMDIARARGIDLSSATQLLVQVENGRYTQLVRQGIVSKEQAKNFKTSEDALKALSATYGGSASAYAETFSGKVAALNAELHNFSEEIGNEVLPAITTMVGTLSTGFNTLDTFYGKVSEGGLSLGKLADFSARMIPGVQVAATAWDAFGASQDHVKTSSERLSEAEDKLRQLTDAGKQNTSEYTDAQNEYNAAKQAATVASNEYGIATQGAADATAVEKQAATDAATAQDAHAKALEKAKTAALAYDDAIFGSADAVITLSKSQRDTTDAINKYNEASKNATASSGRNAEANRALAEATDDAKKQILDEAQNAARAAEEHAKLTGSQWNATRAAAAQKAELQRLAAGLAPGSPLRVYIEGLINQLHRIPNIDRRIAFTVTMNGQVTSFSNVQQAINAGAQVRQDIYRGPRAAGGPVIKGQGYVVGEKGPEFFIPDRSGVIVPHQQLGKMSTGAANGGVVNVNIYAFDTESAVAKIEAWARRNGKSLFGAA